VLGLDGAIGYDALPFSPNDDQIGLDDAQVREDHVHGSVEDDTQPALLDLLHQHVLDAHRHLLMRRGTAGPRAHASPITFAFSQRRMLSTGRLRCQASTA